MLKARRMPGEAAWRWRMQVRFERVVHIARFLVVAFTTAVWISSPHPIGARAGVADGLLITACIYLLAASLFLRGHHLTLRNYPWGSTALDFLLIAMWLWAVGPGRFLYLPLIFCGVATAPLRLMPSLAIVATLAYGGLYALTGGALSSVYVLIAGGTLTTWAALLYRERRDDLRDALTGLLGRRYAIFHIETLLQERAFPFSVALIDLDGFKEINDTHGHEVGDGALCATARLLSAQVRQEDVVARFGGDEFLVIWPGLSGPEGARAAERIRARLSETSSGLRAYAQPLTASFGVTEAMPGCTPSRILARADACLYRAKAQHNAVVVDQKTSGTPDL